MIRETKAQYEDRLRWNSVAYNDVFKTDSVNSQRVLEDLARFCRAHETTFHADPRVHAALEGRREVWLRIQEYLKLDIDQIYNLHVIKETKPGV